MSWSWTIARVRGIPLRVHATLLILPLLAALTFGRAHGAEGALFGVLLTALLFASVALHELGHSLVAQRYGIGVREITLYPFGGIAQLTKAPSSPAEELRVALAGPAVNLVIAASLGLAGWLLGVEPAAQALGAPTLATALAWLVTANLSLALFNLIPALPMDGGRVLRAILEMRLGRRRATEIAGALAQVLAVGMGVWAVLSGQIILGVIAFMVFMGARAELVGVTTRDALEGRTAGELCNRGALTLAPGDTIDAALGLLLRSPQRDFGVVLGEQLLGVLTREHVLSALMAAGGSRYVAGLMQRDVLRVPASMPATQLRERLLGGEGRVACVFEEERLVGLVSLEDLAEAALLLSASREGRRLAELARDGA